MQMYSLCLLLLFAAAANAAVQDIPDNNVNDVHHYFHEEVHLRGKEAELKIIDLDKEEEELLDDYDDKDDNYYDEDYEDEDDEDQDWASGNYDDEDEEEWLDDDEEEDDIPFDDDKDDILDDEIYDEDDDDEDLDWASGDDYDDEDEELLDYFKEEDDIPFDEDKDDILYDEDYNEDDNDEDRDWASDDEYDDEDKEWLDDYEEDDIPFDDDKDDILYQYHAEDYEGTDDHDFSIAYQPPQVRIRDHGKPDKEDETVTVAELSPSSRNLLVSSVYFASGLAVLALFILAFIVYLQLYCNRRSAKQAQLPFVIQHGCDSSALHSSIIKPGKYQPVATQENRSNHSIENDNSLFKEQTQLEEKLLP